MLKLFLCLTCISVTYCKRCRGRYNAGESASAVCDYSTGIGVEEFAAQAYVPGGFAPGGAVETELTGADCVKEDTYLSWFNGEPIAQENGSTQAMCEEKCKSNPNCDAWTLNTNNGWCALKRKDQVKEELQKGFVSGYKICH